LSLKTAKNSAEEIEGYFSAIPLVKEVVAYGATSGSSTDDVKVAVMVYPDPEETKGMTSYEILDLLQREVDVLNTKLPTYKQIQMINLREHKFEKTSSQKIKRHIV
jgi:long-chain acyl-CoA synthetase